MAFGNVSSGFAAQNPAVAALQRGQGSGREYFTPSGEGIPGSLVGFWRCAFPSHASRAP